MFSSFVTLLRAMTLGRGWEIIPKEFLYSATLTDRLRNVYVRVRKASALAEALKLSAAETAYLAAHSDYAIAADGWLNALPAEGSPTPATAAGLFTAVSAVLEYARRLGGPARPRSLGAGKSGKRDLGTRAEALLKGMGES